MPNEFPERRVRTLLFWAKMTPYERARFRCEVRDVAVFAYAVEFSQLEGFESPALAEHRRAPFDEAGEGPPHAGRLTWFASEKGYVVVNLLASDAVRLSQAPKVGLEVLADVFYGETVGFYGGEFAAQESVEGLQLAIVLRNTANERRGVR